MPFKSFMDTNKGAGVLAIARDSGKMLVQLRSKQPSTWGVFGGHIHTNETPSTAAKREFAEETGYNGTLRLIPVYVSRKKIEFHVFLAIIDKEFTIHPSEKYKDETSDYKWVSWQELQELKPKHFGLIDLLEKAKKSIKRMIC